MAFDNGTAAVMNNPATLGLMGKGSRLDVALGFLGPDVSMSMGPGPKSSSSGDAYYMPALGFVQKTGQISYGLALFAQGGMGTEWGNSVFTSNYSPDGQSQRSELGVGRFIAPLTYQVNPDLVVGGSLDFVWAMLDLKMAVPGYYFGPSSAGGLVQSNSAGFTAALTGLTTNWAPGVPSTYGRISFSDSSDYTGKAKGTGFAGKLGFVYKASPTVTIGGTYHSKTALDDLETGSTGAQFTADVTGDGFADMTMPGKMTVRDFQWPAMYGLGIAVQAMPNLMVAADVKHIGWKNVMKNFKMTYTAGSQFVNLALPQNWDNQTVFQLGVAYKPTAPLTLRAGVSLSNNPIPDSTMNYLFPAIEKNHYSVGFGYAFSTVSEINFSLTYAPEVTQTNPNPVPIVGNVPVVVDHSQTNWQLMYTHRF